MLVPFTRDSLHPTIQLAAGFQQPSEHLTGKRGKPPILKGTWSYSIPCPCLWHSQSHYFFLLIQIQSVSWQRDQIYSPYRFTKNKNIHSPTLNKLSVFMSKNYTYKKKEYQIDLAWTFQSVIGSYSLYMNFAHSAGSCVCWHRGKSKVGDVVLQDNLGKSQQISTV